MKFLLLGLGGWISPPLLGTVSVLVQIQDTLILLDCGEGVTRQLLQLKIDPSKLDLLVITHVHGDHILSFPTLILWLKHSGAKRKLRVLGLPDTLKTARLLAELTRIERHLDAVEFIPLSESAERPFKAIENDVFEIYVIKSNHTVESLAVRVNDKTTGLSLVYTSDTKPSERIVNLAQGVDVLIHEATSCDPIAHEHGHSTLLDAITIAERAKAKILVPVHYYVTGEVLACCSSDVCILVPSPGVWYDVKRLVDLCHRFGKR